MRLSVKAQRYPTETETQTFDFKLEVKPCVSLAEHSETLVTDLVYIIGSPYMHVATVNVTENLCHNSVLTMKPIEL